MREAECCRNMRLRETVSIYMTTLLVIVVMLVLCFSPTAPKPSPFPYQVPLDPQGLATLSWNVSYSQQAVYFCLAVTELKFGMLFGMSERGDMRNADLAILWSDGHNSYFGVSQ